MVGRFGKNPVKEIEVANERFAKAGIEIKGFILNAVERKASNATEVALMVTITTVTSNKINVVCVIIIS